MVLALFRVTVFVASFPDHFPISVIVTPQWWWHSKKICTKLSIHSAFLFSCDCNNNGEERVQMLPRWPIASAIVLSIDSTRPASQLFHQAKRPHFNYPFQ